MNPVRQSGEVRLMIGAAKAGNGFGTNFFLAEDAIERAVRSGGLFAREAEGAVVFLRREQCFDRLYYAAAGPARLAGALEELELPPGGVLVSDLVGTKEDLAAWEGVFVAGGFSRYTTILRMQRISSGREADAEADSGVEVADPEDAEEIHAALLANFDVYADQIPPVEEVREAAAGGSILVIREGAAIVALLFYDRAGLTTRLRYWLVLPAYRMSGYGDQLIRRYLHDSMECRRSIVWVHECNSRAIPIYGRRGYKSDQVVDSVLMKRGQ